MGKLWGEQRKTVKLKHCDPKEMLLQRPKLFESNVDFSLCKIQIHEITTRKCTSLFHCIQSTSKTNLQTDAVQEKMRNSVFLNNELHIFFHDGVETQHLTNEINNACPDTHGDKQYTQK